MWGTSVALLNRWKMGLQTPWISVCCRLQLHDPGLGDTCLILPYLSARSVGGVLAQLPAFPSLLWGAPGQSNIGRSCWPGPQALWVEIPCSLGLGGSFR